MGADPCGYCDGTGIEPCENCGADDSCYSDGRSCVMDGVLYGPGPCRMGCEPLDTSERMTS